MTFTSRLFFAGALVAMGASLGCHKQTVVGATECSDPCCGGNPDGVDCAETVAVTCRPNDDVCSPNIFGCINGTFFFDAATVPASCGQSDAGGDASGELDASDAETSAVDAQNNEGDSGGSDGGASDSSSSASDAGDASADASVDGASASDASTDGNVSSDGATAGDGATASDSSTDSASASCGDASCDGSAHD